MLFCQCSSFEISGRIRIRVRVRGIVAVRIGVIARNRVRDRGRVIVNVRIGVLRSGLGLGLGLKMRADKTLTVALNSSIIVIDFYCIQIAFIDLHAAVLYC